MSGKKPWLALSGLVIVAITAASWFWRGDRSAQDQREQTAADDGSRRSLPSAPVVASPPSRTPEPVIDISTRVAPLMQSWRAAIINKDAETVETLDGTFAQHSRAFISALMVSAEGDPEERVRAFSTRVLGKLRPPESAELLRKLLTDRSEYVRFNAAWALGELGDQTAVARLRRIERQDPSVTVRRSASESLRKMEGG